MTKPLFYPTPCFFLALCLGMVLSSPSRGESLSNASEAIAPSVSPAQPSTPNLSVGVIVAFEPLGTEVSEGWAVDSISLGSEIAAIELDHSPPTDRIETDVASPDAIETLVPAPSVEPPSLVYQDASPLLPAINIFELAQSVPDVRPEPLPSLEPLPEPSAPPERPILPPPDELLTPPPNSSDGDTLPGDIPETITVERFDVQGSTVFTPEQFDEVTQPYTGRPITLTELFQARSAVTDLYVNNGYITSGAFIPPQTLQDGVVVIQVVEGSLEAIEVEGNESVDEAYIRRRIALAASSPLNIERLLDGLRLLQLDPLIENLSSELSAGPRPGTSLLRVTVAEADSFDVFAELDNGRSPSVGTFRQRLELSELNVSGMGDQLDLSYTHTEGSNALDGSYQVFLNPRNGSLQLSGGISNSTVIEPPFDELDIQSDSNYVELTYRQPLFRTPTEEFAIGVTASRQQSRSIINIPDEFGGPIPLTVSGADEDGRTVVSALRFFQEWTHQGDRQVFAVRSQFSLGLDALDSTVNNDGRPDSRFLSWRGQAQWVRLLARDTLLLVRGDMQLTDDALVPLEQFGMGGQRTVRGYRQDVLLTDNGAIASAELRIPVLRVPEVNGLLQVVPFIDIGTAWNDGNSEEADPDPETLAGLGLGLLWRMDRLTARLDWGIPLVDVDSPSRTWQEDGVYFSILFNPF